MKSVTKTILDDQVITRMVKKYFSEAEVERIELMNGGMFNSAYRISGSGLPEGQVVLKVGAGADTEILRYEKDIMAAEIKVYGLLQDKEIPTPDILAADQSGEIIPNSYFFMTFLSGQLWEDSRKSMTDAERAGLMEQLGRYNAVVHSVPGEWFGYIKDDKRYQFDNWEDAFTSMMNDILEDGRLRNRRLPYERVRKVMEKHRHILSEVDTPVLVNYDMWAGNIFLSREAGKGCQISGIVDLERAFYGDPYADFTSAGNIFYDVEQEPEFIKGYEEQSGKKLRITANDRIRMNLYRLYMGLIMHVETYRYSRGFAIAFRRYAMREIRKHLDILEK